MALGFVGGVVQLPVQIVTAFTVNIVLVVRMEGVVIVINYLRLLVTVIKRRGVRASPKEIMGRELYRIIFNEHYSISIIKD